MSHDADSVAFTPLLPVMARRRFNAKANYSRRGFGRDDPILRVYLPVALLEHIGIVKIKRPPLLVDIGQSETGQVLVRFRRPTGERAMPHRAGGVRGGHMIFYSLGYLPEILGTKAFEPAECIARLFAGEIVVTLPPEWKA